MWQESFVEPHPLGMQMYNERRGYIYSNEQVRQVQNESGDVVTEYTYDVEEYSIDADLREIQNLL